MWPSDKLIMFVRIYNLHIKTRIINVMIDLSLLSQLFKVYYYCIDIDHIFALIILVTYIDCIVEIYIHYIN